MPIGFFPTTQKSRIVKAAALLFLSNVLLGGGLGLWVEYSLNVLPNHPLYGIAAGIVFADVATFLLLRALYHRGARAAAPQPLPLGDFLDDMLHILLGVLVGFPVAVGALTSARKNWSAPKHLQSGDGLVIAFGIVALMLSLRAAARLATFMRETRRRN